MSLIPDTFGSVAPPPTSLPVAKTECSEGGRGTVDGSNWLGAPPNSLPGSQTACSDGPTGTTMGLDALAELGPVLYYRAQSKARRSSESAPNGPFFPFCPSMDSEK